VSPSVSWSDCCGHLGWLHTVGRRCAPADITGALISALNSVGRGFSIRCSPSTNGRFPPEDRSQPGHWEGDLISDCCTFRSETVTPCTMH
jgi:hypothetical protein